MRCAVWQNVAESAVLTIALSLIAALPSSAFSLEAASSRVSNAPISLPTPPIFSSALPLTAVDLELSLLIDVSGSVDSAEYQLQMQGYQKAFTKLAPQFESGVFGKVAVNAVLWSGADQQQESIPWFLVSDRASALQLAGLFAAVSRPFYGGTAPGSAIAFAAPLFASNAYQGRRWVIDVSGDGSENDGADTAWSRDAALALGVTTINGLPIVDQWEPNLTSWYASNIQGGRDAFTLPAEGFGDFDRAVETKLTREISAAVPEPSSLLGLLTAIGWGWRCRRTKQR